MRLNKFNEMIKNELNNGDMKVVYIKTTGDSVEGGMCHTLDYALGMCYKYYKEDGASCVSILDYSNGDSNILEKDDILHILDIKFSEEDLDSIFDDFEEESLLFG